MVYLQTDDESLPVRRHGGIHDRTLLDQIRLILPKLKALLFANASSSKLHSWLAYRSTLKHPHTKNELCSSVVIMLQIVILHMPNLLIDELQRVA